MKPNLATLRNCRDFLSRLLDLPPDEAIDMLTNHGENQLALFNEGLGADAFEVGDYVMAEPDGEHAFAGQIDGIKSDSGGVLFTVKDMDDDCFDCEAGELRPNQ